VQVRQVVALFAKRAARYRFYFEAQFGQSTTRRTGDCRLAMASLGPMKTFTVWQSVWISLRHLCLGRGIAQVLLAAMK
jgi:hypothetical protein